MSVPYMRLKVALAFSLLLSLVACQSRLLPTPLLTTENVGGVVNVRVASNVDDVEEKSSGGIYRTSTDLELTYDGSLQVIGMRFVGAAVPREATVVNAYLQFKADEATSISTSLIIRGQAINNAPAFFTTSKNVSKRGRTAASVTWSPAAWLRVGEAGPNQRTPNLALIVQEIVSRSGWASGNALAFIITGRGRRVAESFDGDRAGAPLLHPPDGESTARSRCG